MTSAITQKTIWLLDDHAERVVSDIGSAFKGKGLFLTPFSDPLDCYAEIRDGTAPPSALLCDLHFDKRGRIGDDDVGAILPFRIHRRFHARNWPTVTTVLTGYWDDYFGDIKQIYLKKQFAPALICDKLYLNSDERIKEYADCIVALLAGGEPISNAVRHAPPLPSWLLEGGAGGQREIGTGPFDEKGNKVRCDRKVSRTERSWEEDPPAELGADPRLYSFGLTGTFFGALVASSYFGDKQFATALGAAGGMLTAVASRRLYTWILFKLLSKHPRHRTL